MIATRIALSSGDSVYVDACLADVLEVLSAGGLVAIGGRYVNVSQVTQLTAEPVPTLLGITAEPLEAENGVSSN